MREVLPVVSRYRLVVEYNLVQTSPGPTHSGAKLFGEDNELDKILTAGTEPSKTGMIALLRS